MKSSTPLYAVVLILALSASTAYAQLGGTTPPSGTSGSVNCSRVAIIFENLQATVRGTLYRTQDAYDAYSIGDCCEVCYVDRECLAFTFNLQAGPGFGCFLRTEAVRGSIDDIDGCPGCLSGIYTNITRNPDSINTEVELYSLNSTTLAKQYSNSSSRGNGRRMLRAEDYVAHLKY